MTRRIRPQHGSAQPWSTSLWVWPVAAGAVALVAGIGLAAWKPTAGTSAAALWQGGPTSALNVLQATATSVMTATTLIFSLTVLALQLASQQFSPRLLRQLARDPVTRRVLSVLAATFVFATAAMSGVDEDRAVPTVAVIVGLALAVCSFVAILAYITHMVRALRVDTLMVSVHNETDRAIEAFYPSYTDRPHQPEELPLDTTIGVVVPAARSGFVRFTVVDELLAVAARHRLVVRVEARAGDAVTEGTPMATVWGTGGRPLETVPRDVADEIRGAVQLGYERTLDQDVGFGFRQLEDIAVRAMSPSINDPVTAAHAVGHMADLLVGLTGRHLGPTLHTDDAGERRVIVPDRDLRYYLDLMCGQLRRFSAAEPSVLNALLRALRDVAASCRDDQQRREVQRAADEVLQTMDPSMPTFDADSVHDHHRRVVQALGGDVAGAFGDRAGESRSI